MTLCPQTDALLTGVFAGLDLSRSQAEHVARCEHCARALAEARRFDAELGRVGMAVAPEQVPTSVLTVMDGGGATMHRGWNRMAMLVTVVAVVVVAFGAGRWIPAEPFGTGFGPFSGGEDRDAAARRAEDLREREEAALRREAERTELRAWFRRTLSWTIETTSPDEVEIVTAERCGALYTVVFTEDGNPNEFKWLAGHGGSNERVTSGVAQAVDGADIAAARGAAGVECERVIDETPHGPVQAAVRAGAGVPGDATFAGSTLVSPTVAVAVVEGRASPSAEEQRWIGLVRRDGSGWSAMAEEWVGTNIPLNDGLTAYPLDLLDADLPGDIIVGSIPAAIHELELVVKGTVYRYAVEPGAALVLVAPEEFDGSATYRMLSADPSTVAEGSIEQ